MDKSLLPSYEIWNWIKGYEGRYEISNRGRFRSWVKKGGGNTKNKGTIRFSSCPLVKRTFKTKWGYYQTSIGNEAMNDVRPAFSHREVGLMFIPNPKNLPEVNHKWGRKWQNEWFNLEWNTRPENIGHAFETGLIIPAVGEQQSQTKLKNEEVWFIFNSKLPTKELSKMFGVGEDTIGSIKIGRTWTHVTGKERNPKVEKLTPEFILAVFNFNGTSKEAAKYFKKSYSCCNNIKSGIKYSEITGKVFERRNKDSIIPTPELVLGIYNAVGSTKEVAAMYGASIAFTYAVRVGKKYSEITKHNK